VSDRKAHHAFLTRDLDNVDTIDIDRRPDDPAIDFPGTKAGGGIREIKFLELQRRFRP
jgi:hypothetical protein